MKALANRRLYFIDSRTTGASVALKAARHERLPAFYRAVFLDDTETVSYTLGQLRKFRHTVEQEGVALAIGHPTTQPSPPWRNSCPSLNAPTSNWSPRLKS